MEPLEIRRIQAPGPLGQPAYHLCIASSSAPDRWLVVLTMSDPIGEYAWNGLSDFPEMLERLAICFGRPWDRVAPDPTGAVWRQSAEMATLSETLAAFFDELSIDLLARYRALGLGLSVASEKLH